MPESYGPTPRTQSYLLDSQDFAATISHTCLLLNESLLPLMDIAMVGPHLRRHLWLCSLLAATALAAVFATGCADADTADGWTDAAPMPLARGEVSAAVGQRDAGCDEPPCEVVAVVGGYAYPGRTLARVDGYLPDEDRWIDLPDLPEPRHHPAAAGLPDGTIVTSGGAPSFADEEPQDEVWALAPDADDWEPIESLPEPRWGHRLVAMDNRLISIGGHGGDTTFVWTETNGWTDAAPIPMERDHLGAVVIDDEVWAIGGRDPDFTDRVDIYDPEADRWRDGPPLPEPTSAAAVGVVDDVLVVISGEEFGGLTGGIIDASWMLDLRNLDDEQNSDQPWRPLIDPPEDVHGAGDAVVGTGDDQRLLVIGGATWHAHWSALSWIDDVQVLHAPQPADTP